MRERRQTGESERKHAKGRADDGADTPFVGRVPPIIRPTPAEAPHRESAYPTGLFNLIRSLPASLRYEPGVILANKHFVIVPAGFPDMAGQESWIAADVLRVVDGMLAEHWDVLQDEATEAESQSGLPMFGTRFPS